MKGIFKWIKNNPNRFMFLIPIILVAVISISHVVTWYDIANPINWAIYLSIAIEIGAMTALVAATNQIKGGVWFMFGLVTFIQMVGNIFYSYKEIDASGELFKSWIELTGPIWEMLGTETTDTIGLKRYLAYLEGGLLPIISLTSLHFFVKYDKKEPEDVEVDKEEYYKSRNKHIEKLVLDKEDGVHNPLKDSPQDINQPTDKKNGTFPKPEGKEFNTPYPLPDEVKVEVIEESIDDNVEVTPNDKESFPTPVNDQITDEIPEDTLNDDLSERMDKRVEKYMLEEEIETVNVVETDVEQKTIERKIVKQPLKPSKTKINRID